MQPQGLERRWESGGEEERRAGLLQRAEVPQQRQLGALLATLCGTLHRKWKEREVEKVRGYNF